MWRMAGDESKGMWKTLIKRSRQRPTERSEDKYPSLCLEKLTELLMGQDKITGLPEFLEDDHKKDDDLWGPHWMIAEKKDKENVKR
jgi:hypothetical protein